MGWHDGKTQWGNGVQEPGADPAAASGTADAALELCSLAPSLLQTGTERHAVMTNASAYAHTFPSAPTIEPADITISFLLGSTETCSQAQ